MLYKIITILSIFSILSIIIGLIVAIIGATKLPTPTTYYQTHPIPSDPAVLDRQMLHETIHSYGFLLIIIGCSLLGLGILLILGICLSICYNKHRITDSSVQV